MKLAYVDLCGFRGYRKPIRIEFADRFTIIDGRNGVGKSTIFDAIEFALTGTLSKYNGTKAAGQTVSRLSVVDRRGEHAGRPIRRRRFPTTTKRSTCGVPH